MFQGAYNGLFGALVGAVLGVLLTLFLNPFMANTGIHLLGVPGMGLPIELSWMKVIYVFGFAIILSLLASLYPAKKAAELQPADVLRYE